MNLDETKVEPITGLTNDGTQYSLESPEVVAFKKLFPEVTDEVAVSSVVTIHNTVTNGEEPAGDAVEIVEMIRAKIANGAEEISDEDKAEGAAEEAAEFPGDNGEDESEKSEEASAGTSEGDQEQVEPGNDTPPAEGEEKTEEEAV